ncbi:lipopolysaccharide biosynthesis protein [Chitinophaga polysaccharea]|uniref:Wzz/FepE/Etk N-terminal domain-containing protein n=1 Tax=Chitinophaga polysaccharea TaxID=1293035 RepID=UPI001455046C|nr:Wzz/FepE/Etk N-terminal domain-containing protein [Chitinophaga polysaccharea]NLR61844.1 lipopolysaccharide biosynthesis protein [Chitinophaga polysaccharea]
MEEFKNLERKDSEELSLKDLLLKGGDLIKYLRSKWLLILLVGITGAAIGLGVAFTSKVRYKAELTLVMEDNSNGNALGKFAGLAGQLGLDMGSSGRSGIFEGNNIMEFLKSRLMIQRTLLSTATVDGKDKTLADWYLDFNHIREKWRGNKILEAVSFPVDISENQFNRTQDSVLQVLHKDIIKNCLLVDKSDEKLNFISVKCTSANEAFSKKFVELLVDKAIAFYLDVRTQRSRKSIDRLQSQADSLEIMLNRKTYSAAAVQDLNLNPARQQATIGAELAMRDKMILQTMYGEVVKNLELSKISMAQETPIIQIIDTPIMPLEKIKLGKVKAILIGGLAAGFLICFYLILISIYKSIMAN